MHLISLGMLSTYSFNLKVFEYTTCVHSPKETMTKAKIEYKTIDCWLLHYDDGIKSYRL